ncbi:MAG: hypothetical protein OXC30_05410 [Alphaproteobacteria bacterium]|nr:hypothetical protein [Alphaproteobacteria bacterium]
MLLYIFKSFFCVLALGSQALLCAVARETDDLCKSPVCVNVQRLLRAYHAVSSKCARLREEGTEDVAVQLSEDTHHLAVLSQEVEQKIYKEKKFECDACHTDWRLSSQLFSSLRESAGEISKMSKMVTGRKTDERCKSPFCVEVQSVFDCYEALGYQYARLFKGEGAEDPTQLSEDTHHLAVLSQEVEQKIYKEKNLECDACHTGWQSLASKLFDFRTSAEKMCELATMPTPTMPTPTIQEMVDSAL